MEQDVGIEWCESYASCELLKNADNNFGGKQDKCQPKAPVKVLDDGCNENQWYDNNTGLCINFDSFSDDVWCYYMGNVILPHVGDGMRAHITPYINKWCSNRASVGWYYSATEGGKFC